MRAAGAPRRQRGIYVVEFAIVAAVFLFIVFAAIEVGRLMFTWGALDAMTQRGARVATVCPIGDQRASQLALFGPGGNSSIVPGVTAANIQVEYLDDSQTSGAGYANAEFVRVSIVNYTHQMLIPNLIASFVSPNILSPTFETTLPRESLGWDPDNSSYSCF